MPRPKANPDQHQKAYQLWRQGQGQKEIYDTLSGTFDTAVSERTVSNWIKGFKQLAPQTLAMDSPFQWSQTELHGLPWEASGFIMEMCYVKHRMNSYGQEQYLDKPHLPTFREALWWWRIHLAAPEIASAVGKPHDIIALGSYFVYREISHLVLGFPLEMEDLEALLWMKPWLDDERHQEYHRQTDMGLVPRFKQPAPPDWVMVARAAEERPEGERRFFLAASIDEDHPELLMSQQAERKGVIFD